MAPRSPPVLIELEGRLTHAGLERALASTNERLATPGGTVLFDCRRMTSYELDARHAFVAWNARMKPLVRRVAVLTSNRMWWVVVGAMSLASGQEMRAFGDEAEALAWLR